MIKNICKAFINLSMGIFSFSVVPENCLMAPNKEKDLDLTTWDTRLLKQSRVGFGLTLLQFKHRQRDPDLLLNLMAAVGSRVADDEL